MIQTLRGQKTLCLFTVRKFSEKVSCDSFFSNSVCKLFQDSKSFNTRNVLPGSRVSFPQSINAFLTTAALPANTVLFLPGHLCRACLCRQQLSPDPDTTWFCQPCHPLSWSIYTVLQYTIKKEKFASEGFLWNTQCFSFVVQCSALTYCWIRKQN